MKEIQHLFLSTITIYLNYFFLYINNSPVIQRAFRILPSISCETVKSQREEKQNDFGTNIFYFQFFETFESLQIDFSMY